MKDTKTISIFITLFIYGLLVTVWGIRLEGNVSANGDDISDIKKEIVAYRDLPLQVENLQTTQNETLRLVGIIRDGLIAKGIIKPAR